MTAKQKQQIVKILEAARGDDYHRAQSAFRGHDLSVQYGMSGKTKGEILDGYREHSANIDSLIAAVNQIESKGVS